MYRPDKWVVLRIDSDELHYRLLATWSGGYLDGDSWRINSGITKIEIDSEDDNRFLVYGSSGSIYNVHKDMYGIAGGYNCSVLNDLLERDYTSLMDEDINWLEFDWDN